MKRIAMIVLSMIFALSISGSAAINEGIKFDLRDEGRARGILLEVDYDLSVEKLMEQGGHIWKFGDIDSDHYPSQKTGKAALRIMFMRFYGPMKTQEMLKKIDAAGYRPADLKELLAIGIAYPEMQKRNRIFALGSSGPTIEVLCDDVILPSLSMIGDDRAVAVGCLYYSAPNRSEAIGDFEVAVIRK